jgi:hypothetical protein
LYPDLPYVLTSSACIPISWPHVCPDLLHLCPYILSVPLSWPPVYVSLYPDLYPSRCLNLLNVLTSCKYDLTACCVLSVDYLSIVPACGLYSCLDLCYIDRYTVQGFTAVVFSFNSTIYGFLVFLPRTK